MWSFFSRFLDEVVMKETHGRHYLVNNPARASSFFLPYVGTSSLVEKIDIYSLHCISPGKMFVIDPSGKHRVFEHELCLAKPRPDDVVMMALASTTIPSANVLVFLLPFAIAAHELRIRRGLLSPPKDFLCEGLVAPICRCEGSVHQGS